MTREQIKEEAVHIIETSENLLIFRLSDKQRAEVFAIRETCKLALEGEQIALNFEDIKKRLSNIKMNEKL